MPSPVLPSAYKVLVKGTLFTIPVENVWAVQGPDPFDVSAAATIAGVFQTAYGAIAAELSEDIEFTEIEVTNYGGLATGQYIFAITPPQAGGLGVGSLPGSVAFCVSLRTALSGRRFRGRKYFSGLAESDVTGNFLSPTRGAAIVTACEDLKDALNSAGYPLAVFSPTGVTLTDVVTCTATDYKVDSQRGRLK